MYHNLYLNLVTSYIIHSVAIETLPGSYFPMSSSNTVTPSSWTLQPHPSSACAKGLDWDPHYRCKWHRGFGTSLRLPMNTELTNLMSEYDMLVAELLYRYYIALSLGVCACSSLIDNGVSSIDVVDKDFRFSPVPPEQILYYINWASWYSTSYSAAVHDT